MAIFSRRVIQGLIERNCAFLTGRQTRCHVDALNRGGAQAIATEWEMAVLAALSTKGRVTHEPDHLGRTRPDILFEPSNTSMVGFVADITTVSDAGRDEANPLGMLRDELWRLVARKGFSPNRFSLAVKEARPERGPRKVMKLALPPKGQLSKIFGKPFREFLAQCVEDSSEVHQYRVRDGESDIEIGYDPASVLFGVTHPSFDVAYDDRRNPIYNALERKAEQLSPIETHLPRGIVLCAADTKVEERGRGARYGPRRIVRYFFRQHRSIDFVVVLASLDISSSFSKRHARLYCRVYTTRNGRHRLGKRTLRLLEHFHKSLPNPRRSGESALRLWKHLPRSFSYPFAGWRMSNNYIRFSARELLSVLSGARTIDQFLERNRLGDRDSNAFRRWQSEGRLLTNVRLAREAEQDDDWFEMTVGEPDPAVSPFRARNQDAGTAVP